MIVGFAGKARCGKNTAASVLEGYGFSHFSFAAPIREMACNVLNVTLEQLESMKEVPHPVLGGKTPREFMQKLGTEFGRDMISRSIWVDSCMNKVYSVDNAVVSDVRFDNEAEAIISNGGVIIHIDRPGSVTTAHSNHASEQGLPPDLITHVIVNDGTVSSLAKKIETILNL